MKTDGAIYILTNISPFGNRCHGAADQGALAAAPGGHGRAREPDLAPAQAPGQDGRRRQGRRQRPHGLLVQDRRHHQDRRPQRRGGCRCYGRGFHRVVEWSGRLLGCWWVVVVLGRGRGWFGMEAKKGRSVFILASYLLSIRKRI